MTQLFSRSTLERHCCGEYFAHIHGDTLQQQQHEREQNMSTYSVNITNSSGAPQNVAMYQVYPNLGNGLPLVWFAKNINDKNNNSFQWDVEWGLNWGTTLQPLVEGVLWESGGSMVSTEPNKTGGINQMTVSRSGGDFMTSGVIANTSIPPGSMQVLTDTSFTVPDALKMSIAVYMKGKPTFAMQGKPNGKYLFDTHPTYYVCVTDHKEGVAVSGTYVSSPTEVIFKGGSTSLNFTLDPTLTFKPMT